MIKSRMHNIKNIFSGTKLPTRAYSLSFRRFRPKVRILIERKNFVVKTVGNHDELGKVLSLRYDVFFREYKGKDSIIHFDIDRFDKICDHIIVINKINNNVIGCYRILSSEFTGTFYSQTEFELNEFISQEKSLLEVGRACVHKDFRNGITISLLWFGLVEYIKKVKADYLFGCSSVKTDNVLEISLLYRYLMQCQAVDVSYGIKPMDGFRVKELARNMDLLNHFDVDKTYGGKIVPGLLKSYIKAGAIIASEPAYDRNFGCADFLTILDTKLINENYRKKFVQSGQSN